jgi:ribokinase
MKEPVKIISIGAGVQDVFLQGKLFKPHREADGEMVEEFELGSKNDIEGVVFSTGGGGTNAAVTFARQGMHSCYMGHLGDDIAAQAVLDDLHGEGIDTSLVKHEKQAGTGYSTLLLAPSGERTILTYRGVSADFTLHEADFHSTKADWLYISSLGGNIAALRTILHYAKAHSISVAINPGKGELKHKSEMRGLLPDVSILSLNKEELQMIFDGDSLQGLVINAAEHVPCVIGTDGPKGAIAVYQDKIYKAGMYEDVPVIDRTGAGDAFSSGFVAMAATGESIEHAMTFASANSTSVVGKIGAKAGILQAHTKLHAMPIAAAKL